MKFDEHFKIKKSKKKIFVNKLVFKRINSKKKKVETKLKLSEAHEMKAFCIEALNGFKKRHSVVDS